MGKLGELTNDEVFDVLVINGIDAVENYMNGDSCADPKTALRWREAREAINELRGYLEEQTERDFDDE